MQVYYWIFSLPHSSHFAAANTIYLGKGGHDTSVEKPCHLQVESFQQLTDNYEILLGKIVDIQYIHIRKWNWYFRLQPGGRLSRSQCVKLLIFFKERLRCISFDIIPHNTNYETLSQWRNNLPVCYCTQRGRFRLNKAIASTVTVSGYLHGVSQCLPRKVHGYMKCLRLYKSLGVLILPV